MRCSWIEKNRSRNLIYWEHTENDDRGVISLFCGNLIHMSTSGGRSRVCVEDLLGRLVTIFVVVASGMWWSVLDLMLVLGTVSKIVTRLATLVADPKESAWRRVVRWTWVEWSRSKDGLGALFWRNMLFRIQIFRF